MKRWVGRWIMGVGVIHCAFGLLVFRSTWQTLAVEGLFNAVNGQAEREFPFWFLAFGLLAILLGAVLDHLESLGLALPAFVGRGLLGLTALFLVVMPLSGVWLLVPAVVGALISARRSRAPRTTESVKTSSRSRD